MMKLKINKIYTYIKDGIKSAFTSPNNVCLVCNTPIQAKDEYICSNCLDTLSVSSTNKCNICNRISTNNICSYCQSNNKSYSKIYTLFEYKEPINKFINEFKEQGNTLYGKVFTKYLLDMYDTLDLPQFDIITIVPANLIRQILRLRNAPNYFAKALASHTGIPYKKHCLSRIGHQKAMRQRTPSQRMDIAAKSYINSIKNINLKGKKVLLIDDVLTTGATTHTCSNLLISRGAKCVYVLAVVSVMGK